MGRFAPRLILWGLLTVVFLRILDSFSCYFRGSFGNCRLLNVVLLDGELCSRCVEGEEGFAMRRLRRVQHLTHH